MHHSLNRSVEFFTGRFYSEQNLSTERPSLDDLPGLFGPSSLTGRSDESTSAAATETLLKICDAVNSVSTDESQADLNDAAHGNDSDLFSLAGLLPRCRFFTGSDIRFHSIAKSAEQCTPGQLVVYRIGIDDPEEVISQALARGAAGILTEQILPVPLPQCICGDTGVALAEMSAKILIDETGARPDQQLLTIGIVGDSGKSTTAMCLATILRDIPCRVAYETDLGHSDGITSDVSGAAACVGAELLTRLSDAADAGAAVSIIELDSMALRSGGYDQIGFDVLLITGRNSARRDFGPSPVECALERIAIDGVVVVSTEDQRSLRLVKQAGYAFLTYGVDVNADVSLKTIGIEDGVLTGMIRHDTNSAIMESSLGSGFFAESIIAASAVGVATDNPLVQIAESVSKLRELPGRCENIAVHDWDIDQSSPNMVLDAAGTPERTESILKSIRSQMSSQPQLSVPMSSKVKANSKRSPKLWCVLAVSELDDSDTLARYGRLLETMPDHCVLTCHPDSKQHFLSLSHGVLDGVQDIAAMRLVADQERAITWATQCASPQDTIVVIGGIDRRSAHAQRDQLQRLQQLMQRLRTEHAAEANRRESQPKAKSSPEPSSASKLKIFNPEG